MNMSILDSVTRLPDRDLLSRLADLARRERDVTVELIAHLAELDARKLHRGEGYGSLFRYCTDALRLSEHAAFCRIEAARIARTFPVVLDRLADGSLNLTTLRLLGPHLRPENHLELLAEAAGRSKRDVKVLVARLAPQPDVPASVRKLPASRPAEALQEVPAALPPAALPPPPAQVVQEQSPGAQNGDQEVSSALPHGAEHVAAVPPGQGPDASLGAARAVPAPALASTVPHRPLIEPLAPERYRVQFTIGAETHEKLRLVQDLLRREIPDGDPAAIFDRALTLLVEDTAKRKVGAAAKPRPGRSRQGSRHIPADVKRKVWVRDRGQCAFVSNRGRRCTERSFLELHHLEPYGMGGETVTRNISLRCRSHNIYEAELAFGADVVVARQWAARDRTRSGPSTQASTRSTAQPEGVAAPPKGS
jgi:hypothetical protein